MMTVGPVGYLGSAPAMSVFGLASVFLYVLPGTVPRTDRHFPLRHPAR
jgi:hypothetical protein